MDADTTTDRSSIAGPSIGVVRRVAWIEAVSYLVLMVAVVAKYAADQPVGVQVMGPIHGVIVLGYAGVLVAARQRLGWTDDRVIRAIVLGALPLGGFWVDRRWLAPLDPR